MLARFSLTFNLLFLLVAAVFWVLSSSADAGTPEGSGPTSTIVCTATTIPATVPTTTADSSVPVTTVPGTSTSVTSTNSTLLTGGQAGLIDGYNSGFDDPGRSWAHNPFDLFGPSAVDQSSGPFQGTYSHARQGGQYWAHLSEALEMTGDTARYLPRMIALARTLSDVEIGDHDGRGYEYTRYRRDIGSSTDRFVETDLNFLDEQLSANTIAHMGFDLHRNRDVDPEAGELADRLFDYLDQTWVPKWMARTGTEPARNDAYLDWAHPATPDADAGSNRQNWGRGERFFDGSMFFPVRSLLHPFVGSAGAYHMIGTYYAETGRPSIYGADAYLDDAAARVRWLEAVTVVADHGGLVFPHNLSRPLEVGNSPNLNTYWRDTSIWVHELHRHGYLPDLFMEGIAATFTGLLPDDINDPSPEFMDGTGRPTGVRLGATAWFAPYDPSGKLSSLINQSIGGGPDGLHLIDGNTARHDGNLYIGLLKDLEL